MLVVRCKCDREQAIADASEPAIGVVVDDDARDFLECVGWRLVSGAWACPFCACEGRCDECGAALAHVVGGDVQAVLCPECDHESGAFDEEEEEGPLCDLCHRQPASDEAVLAGLCEGCALPWLLAHDEGPDEGSN